MRAYLKIVFCFFCVFFFIFFYFLQNSFSAYLSINPKVEPYSLNWCIITALKRNLTLKEKKLSVLESQKDVTIQFKKMLPTISTKYSYVGLKNVNVINIMGRDIAVSSHDNYDWQIIISQPIFEAGALLNNYKAAKIKKRITELELTSLKNQIIRDVKIAYFKLLMAKKILEERKSAVKRLRSHLIDAKSLFEVGLLGKNDLLASKVALSQAIQDEIKASHDVMLLRSQLNLLLRRELTAPLYIKDSFIIPERVLSFSRALSMAVRNRPELKAAKLAIKKAELLLDIARSNYLPHINLNAIYDRKGITPDLSDNPYGQHESEEVSVVATWNLWSWGADRDRCQKASYFLSQARINYKVIYNNISIEVQRALLKQKEALNAYKVAKESLQQAKENFDINQEKFREKLVSNTDVLDAQDLLVKARTRYFKALADISIATSQLDYAIGKAYQ